MNALYRPGPMEFIDEFIERKYGLKEVIYQHQILEPILKETYGVIVYQEQVIQIANKVGGMSLAEADILRRAMGKKDLAAMKEQKEKFIGGAVKNGISKRTAEEIFDAIDKFANYGFNKSHAVAYSYVAYQTAYLKAHYTAEFLAANLTNEFGNSDKVALFLEDCRKLKIEVLPPDVNNPSVTFDVQDGKIRFGMSAIKNVGISAVEEIIKAKEKLDRNFTSIFDFCANVDTHIVNKRALEGLVLAGAFDSINNIRSRQLVSVENALDYGNKVRNSILNTENSLFGGMEEVVKLSEPSLPEIPSWTPRERLAKEREVLGFYVTDHPLRKYELEYKSFASIQLGDTEKLEDTDIVRACGVITELKTKIDKSNRKMAFFKLDDFSGSCECLMFSKVYEEYGKYIYEEECVLITGRTESSGDAIKLHIDKVIPLHETKDELTESLRIQIDKKRHPVEKISELKNILDTSEGNIPLYIDLLSNGSKPARFTLKNKRVSITDDLIRDITGCLGEDSVTFVCKK